MVTWAPGATSELLASSAGPGLVRPDPPQRPVGTRIARSEQVSFPTRPSHPADFDVIPVQFPAELTARNSPPILRNVDTGTREEIAASVAAHSHLGSEYDAMVSESLVERIGEDIDRRVDARLARQDRHVAAPRPVWASLVMGLGSIGLGVGATGAALHTATIINSTGISSSAVSGGQVGLDVVIWIVIGIVNVAYARHR